MEQRPSNKQGGGFASVIILLVILCINFPVLIVPALAALTIFWGIYRAKKAAAPPSQDIPSHPGFPPKPPQNRTSFPPVRTTVRKFLPPQAYAPPKSNFWQNGNDPWDLPPEPDPWDL